MSTATFTASYRLLSSAWPARSSHSLALLAPSHAIVFGGELQARKPVPSDVNALALLSDSHAILRLKVTGEVPAPRVGAVLVQYGQRYYVWGGRGGSEMQPLEGVQMGPFVFKVEDATVEWETVRCFGEVPMGRSYHAAAILGDTMYIHAGCPSEGRLADLYSFDIPSSTWTRLADAPGPARGGTVLAPATVTLNGTPQSVLLRYGGFAGYELGSVDMYLPNENVWRTVQPDIESDGAPGARSVHGFVAVNLRSLARDGDGDGTGLDLDLDLVVVLFMGEREPSAVGHAGAGTFWPGDDVWGLFQKGEDFLWRKLTVSGAVPEGRGWFAFASVPSGSNEKDKIARILIHGGLLASNERSGEVWVLEVTQTANT